jgi:hypothetical protein
VDEQTGTPSDDRTSRELLVRFRIRFGIFGFGPYFD